jgi:hypothetical protein
VRALCAVVLAALLGGCSTVRFVYDNAEVYLRWSANSYLDLRGPMEEELDERVAAFMAWHRKEALPQYARIADEARTRLSLGLTPADLDWGYDAALAQVRESLRAAAEQLAPLLDRLDARQVEHLAARMAEENRRFARDNLRGSEGARRSRRTERNVARLEAWVGTLSQQQTDLVARYSQRAPLLDELRAREHQRLQNEVLRILRAGQARERLPDLAEHVDRGREPAYVAAIEASRREYFAMALELDRSLTPEQRGRAADQLARYADDFRALNRR